MATNRLCNSIAYPLLYLSGHSEHCRKQLLIHVQLAFVLGNITLAVSLIQYAPLGIGHADRVLQALKDQVAGLRSIAFGTQSCERQGVSCVVSKIESAFEADFGSLAIDEQQAA